MKDTYGSKRNIIVVALIVVMLCVVGLLGVSCTSNDVASDDAAETNTADSSETATETTPEDTRSDTTETPTDPDDATVPDDDATDVADDTGAPVDTVQQLLDSMSTEEKVLQMFIITPEALTGVGEVVKAGETTQEALQNYPVGGLIYFAQNLEDTDQTKEMLTNTQSFAKYGLFLGVDEEGGPLVSRIANSDGLSVEQFPAMETIGEAGDTQAAYNVGETIGGYLTDLGFNMDYAPVADVLTNPNNTVIGSRSFGSDAQLVADMVSEEVLGFQQSNTVSVLKHFPGHGGTDGDSHEDAVESDRTLEELESCEFLPFQAGISAGADCVMVGHITLPEVTDDGLPATLSSQIVTGILRDRLGFDGIVITDSMSMGAITEYYSSGDAAVAAINAGCDIILMPEDFQEALQGVLDALNDGTLTEDRLDESVYRILSCKIKHNIIGTD